MKTLKNNTMKTFITSFFAAILIISASAFAKAETKASRLATTTNSVDLYIESITKGNVESLNDLFSAQFRQNTNANGKVTTHTKEELVNFMKRQKNIKQNCSSSYTLIEQNATTAIAKVEMKYRDFTKVDYVTLGREGNDWKVNQVVTTYN